ncbi:MAG: AraC family transcriptional regulator, partial [Acidobacteriota bacterium]
MLQVEVPKVESIQAIPRDHGRRHFVFVAVPDADPFDLIGPMAVLREANFFLESSGRPDLMYSFEVVSNKPGTTFEADGMRIAVDRACYEVGNDVDTVVFQAIDLEGNCLRDEKFVAWIRRISKRARRTATACIGTYLLAEAGLLDGRRAATHWALGGDFTRRYPEVTFDNDPIYIKEGNLYTSAGVTSILDLMLALVEEDFGTELALRVAQGLVMFLRRPATQSQFSMHLAELETEDAKIRDVVSHIMKNLSD